MTYWSRRKGKEKNQRDRLEEAEKDLASLKRRLARSNRVLFERTCENHWRETIEKMIQGAP